MNKLFKKISVILIASITAAILLASCSTAEGVKEDVEKGAKKVEQGVEKGVEDVKEGAKDVKEGAEDIVGNKNQGSTSKQEFDSAQSKASLAALVGTWTGTEKDGDKYKISFYEDGTYESVEMDKTDKEKDIHSGKYSIEGSNLTLNKEKKLENGKVTENKEVDKHEYTLENSNKLVLKGNGKEEISLNKENSIAEKKIK